MIAGRQRSADEVLIEYGVREGVAAIRDGVVTSTEHVEACLARIAATDDRLQGVDHRRRGRRGGRAPCTVRDFARIRVARADADIDRTEC